MEYFKLYDVLFIAMDDKSSWVINSSPNSIGDIKGLTMIDTNDNPEFIKSVKDDGIKISNRVFEMKIPKKLNAQEHFNISFYLNHLNDKERKL